MKVVIFCGGFGTRMWPTSTKSYPKQFRYIVKGKSFFQRTLERYTEAFDVKDISISTESSYKQLVMDQGPEIPPENIILEPERKDSLGAVGLVAAIVEKRFPKEVMFFSWSDHFIGKVKILLKSAKEGMKNPAVTCRLVTQNDNPTYPTIH